MAAKWLCVGKSAYLRKDWTRGDTFVWKEKDGWYREQLPGGVFTMALASARLSPQGMFSKSNGPFKTMAQAKLGR
jgi:hypothetical protein